MFRDETEAAIARAEAAERRLAEIEQHEAQDEAEIEALKRTIAEQRAEIERLARLAGIAEKEEAKPRRVKKARRPAGATLLSRIWAVVWATGLPIPVGLIGLSALVALGAQYVGSTRGRHMAESGPGRLYAVQVVQSHAGQARLLVVSEALRTDNEYRGSRWRIDLVNPATGKRLIRRVFERRGRPELLPAAPGRFWCESSTGGLRLELRDVDTLDVVASSEALARRNPALAAGLHGSIQVDGWSGSAIVMTKTGSSLLVDSRSFTARPFVLARELVSMDSNVGGGYVLREALQAASLPDGALPLHESHNVVTHEWVGSPSQRAALRKLARIRMLGQSQRGSGGGGQAGEIDLSFVAVDGGPREALSIDRGPEDKVTRRQSTFLSPELLWAYGTTRALTLPEGGGLIVAHTDSLDRDEGHLLLSRLSLDGKTHWTVSEPRGSVTMATLQGDLVVVAIEREPSVLLGIAWRDGCVRWRYAI